jgi:TolB-like protein/pimeloyl-ACP methyl ester carboxylesterase/Flp pilus assembly protein TadD
MAQVRLTLFGGFAVRRSDGEAVALPTRKAEALLAVLACRPGEAQLRERLTALLWGERGDQQARHSLSQTLTSIRRALNGAAPALATEREEITLCPKAVAADVAEFQRLAAGDSVADLQAAAALYRGPLLEGLKLREPAFEEWLGQERMRLHDLAMTVMMNLAERQASLDDNDAAAATLNRALALDPLAEEAHRQLIRLHLERGSYNAAIRHYRQCCDVLKRELDTVPEPSTTALYREALGRLDRVLEPTATAPSPASASNDARQSTGAGPAPNDQGHRPAIAVLPFVNMSGDPGQEYFADGLTEDIITDLSRLSALFVVARNTVFTFKGKAVQVQEAARTLAADYILEGSVRRADDRVRITAQLIDGRTGGHLWAHRYDRSLDDIFALQDEIACTIAETLEVKLRPDELPSIAARTTTNAEAYKYYLMGRSFFLRNGWGKRALHVARQMFVRASVIDPSYARAHAGIANCDSYLLCMGDPDVSVEDILATSARALVLEPQLAEAHAAKGLALYTAGRHAEANAALAEAVRLGPDSFEAHFFAARNCRAQGRYAESAGLFERAAELQPEDFRALGLAVNAYRSLGQHSDMLFAARHCLERVEAEIAVHPDNASALAFGAGMLVALGEQGRAEGWADRAARIAPIDSITNYNLACAYAALGNADAAMARLHQVFSDPPASQRSHVEWLKHDSSFEPLRGHPEFEALLQRLEAETKPLGDEPSPAEAIVHRAAAFTQQIRFCVAPDGVRIAYASAGQGPPLVKTANWLNHLEFDWQSPVWRHMLNALAADFHLIRYDARGNGLSDWEVADLSFGAMVRDLETVVDAAGLERFPLLGISQGCAVSVAYAIRHPERVTRLVLHGGFAKGWRRRGNPTEIARREAMLTLIEQGWGQDNPAFRQLFTSFYIPDGNRDQMRWWNDLQRVTTSPDNAVRVLNALSDIDVTELLPRLRVPTLVLHSRGDAAIPFESGRELATAIAGARFVPLDSRNHVILEQDAEWPRFLAEIQGFLAAPSPNARSG